MKNTFHVVHTRITDYSYCPIYLGLTEPTGPTISSSYNNPYIQPAMDTLYRHSVNNLASLEFTEDHLTISGFELCPRATQI